MIAALVAIGSFLKGNWTWAIPLALLVGVSIDDGLHRLWLAECQLARAEDVTAAEKAKNAALARAQALSDELIIAQAQAMAVTEKTVTVYRDRINNAPKTNGCGPTVHDAARGVLDTLGAGGGQAPAQRGTPAGLRAPQGDR